MKSLKLITDMKLKLIALFLFAFLLSGKKVLAVHIAGAYIEYEYKLANDNYEIRIIVYNDCDLSADGALEFANISLDIVFPDNPAFVVGQTLAFEPVGAIPLDVSPLFCPSGSGICNGGPLDNRKMFKHIFTAHLNIPASNAGGNRHHFTIHATVGGARDEDYTTADNSGTETMDIFAENFPLDHQPNNSVFITQNPPWIACVNGSDQQYDPGLVTTDAIVATLDMPFQFLGVPGVPIDYVGAFSNINPITWNSVSLPNGILHFTPTNPGEVGPLKIRFQELDASLNNKGFTTIDFEIWTRTCTAQTPPTLLGFNNTNNFVLNICNNTSTCFDIYASEVDLGDGIFMIGFPYGGGNLPGCCDLLPTFFGLGSHLAYEHICWTPTTVGTYVVHAWCMDEGCPHLKDYADYTINVLPNNLSVSIPPPDPICMNSCTDLNEILPVVSGNVGALSYSWSPSTDLSCSTCSNPVACPTITTTYTLTVHDAASTCDKQAEVVVTVLPVPDAPVLSGTIYSCDPNQLFTATTSYTTGTLHWSVSNGTITPAVTTLPANTVTASWNSNAGGTVSVYYVDANGCPSATATFNVGSCCLGNPVAQTYTNISSSSLGVTSVSSTSTIAINGVFTINQPAFDFINCTDVVLNSGAEIIVLPGCTLTIENSYLHACNDMWKHIYVSSNGNQVGKVIVKKTSLITEAEIAVESEFGGVVQTEGNSTFNRNHIHIKFENDMAYNAATFNQSSIQQTNFFCDGNLLPPWNYSQNNQTRTYYCIDVEDVMYLEIGETSGFGLTNRFNNFSTAINANNCFSLAIYNNHFYNTHQTWFDNNSIGVYFHTPSPIAYNCNLTVGGMNDYEPNEFRDFSGYCIWSKANCNANIVNNDFYAPNYGTNTVCTAAIYAYSNFANVNTWLDSYTITDNRIWGNGIPDFGWRFGVHIFDWNSTNGFISGSAKIMNNYIEHCQNGIKRENFLNNVDYKTTVMNNNIQHVQNGIWISSQNTSAPYQPVVYNNEILVDAPYDGTRSYGIRTDNSMFSEVTCNNVYTNTTVTHGDPLTDGIYLIQCPSSRVCSNHISFCERDLECRDKMPATSIVSNWFEKGMYGFVLNGDHGVVGPQGWGPYFINWTLYPGVRNNNLWTGFNAANTNYHAMNCSLDPAQSPFTTSVTGPNFYYPLSPVTNTFSQNALYPLTFNSTLPDFWFDDNVCKAQNICDLIITEEAPPHERGDSAWMRSVLDDSSMMDIDSSGTISAEEIASATNHYFNNWVLYKLMRMDTTDAGGDTALLNYYNALVKSSIGKFDSVETLISSARTLNNSSLLDSALQLRGTIPLELLPEINSHTVLGIYMHRFLADSIYIDSSEYEALFAIATQCPGDGGVAVFNARSMLNFFYDDIDYADWCEKLSVSASTNRNEFENNNVIESKISFNPNPAKDNMIVSFTGLTDGSVLEIFDVTGRKVYTSVINYTSGFIQLNVADYSQGIYTYRVEGNSVNNLRGKFAVIK